MQTRSSSKFIGKPSTNPKRRNRKRSKPRVEPFSLEETPVVTMVDQRTMAELLRAPTEGYAKAIVVPPIPAEHFELKHSLINLCMQTRSSSKFIGKPSTNPKRRNRKRSKPRVEPFSLEETPVVTMVDQRTMAELLRAPTEGYAKAIVVPPIPAEHFELKHSLINLVTSKQFFGFEKEDPQAHIRYFNKITSTLRYKDVPESSIKLMLFLISIDGPARIWLDKEPSQFYSHLGRSCFHVY
nr:reverse transcriptase domain-containing protein [Tanacetum cinerariifolium]